MIKTSEKNKKQDINIMKITTFYLISLSYIFVYMYVKSVQEEKLFRRLIH